ncbi:hypothetical protein Tco_0895596 [Tanacetum coccineum]|uniref:Uncharacterized protein n=1 Tax=Tanacetum coccineum TaxID=301880 RepID=A0ABQ5CLA8_9ASTR
MNRMEIAALGSVSGVPARKVNTVGNVGTHGTIDCGFPHSNVGQQMTFRLSLVDPAGDSTMRNSDLIGRMEYSGSSLCQARKRALDSRLITNSTKATRGHLSIHVVSATSSCATSS